MKMGEKMGQVGVKMEQNRGSLRPHAYLLLVPKQDYAMKDHGRW